MKLPTRTESDGCRLADPEGGLASGRRSTRRLAQVVSLLLWVLLFLAARSGGGGEAPSALFVMVDPLLATLVMVSGRVFLVGMLGAAFFVLLTVLLGRVFCGWLCPLGTLIDLAARLSRSRMRLSQKQHRFLLKWKYYVLAVMVIGALLSAQWAYVLDPIVLLYRAFSTAIFPLAAMVLPESWTGMSAHEVGFTVLLMLAVVLGLTWLAPRFFCRYLCPLGAVYALLSRLAILKREVRGCNACAGAVEGKRCTSSCRMGAIPDNPHHTASGECILCLTCQAGCEVRAVGFEWTAPGAVKPSTAPVGVSRRSFLLHTAGGLCVAPLALAFDSSRTDSEDVVRPPQVVDEDRFLDLCVRCGMCVQACPTQTLQPDGFLNGLSGLWTPRLTPTLGGCIEACNACSVACPTGAIPPFGIGEKWSRRMGLVVFRSERCASYAEHVTCLKCIEICPTNAFIVQPAGDGHVRRPAEVVDSRCIGCGLCEHVCRKMVKGTPALVTLSRGRGEAVRIQDLGLGRRGGESTRNAF